MGSDPAIVFADVGKRYYLKDNDANPVRRWMRRAVPSKRQSREHWALKDVNLRIQPGESVAVIGVNGSGKSTFLKLINGISRTSCGTLRVNGRVGGILELGAGFHPNLTGYENIFLQGTLLGLSRSEIWDRLPAIEDFCELGKFLNSPVKHYSMGMFLRLGFAIAVHTEPEIFIIDEALAVGDGYFMWKCTEKLEAMKSKGLTLIYVSHVPEQVESLCQRAIWIHQGRIHEDGPITDVLEHYHQFQFAKLLEGLPQQGTHKLSALIPYARFGTGEAVLQNVKITNLNGEISRFYPMGEPMELTMDAVSEKEIPDVSLYVIIERPNQSVTFIDSQQQGYRYSLQSGVTKLKVHFDRLPLRPGSYLLTVAMGEAGNWSNLYDAHQKIYSFIVTEPATDRKYIRGLFKIETSIQQAELS